MGPHLRRMGGVGALAFWLAVTASWWALALWPVPRETPAWLIRARAVCFNATGSGLPDASGWLLLVGQPIGLLAVLMVIWGDAVRSGLRALGAVPAGRALLGSIAVLLVAGFVAAGGRVISASPTTAASNEGLPSTYPRLDRPAPALGLVDQHGRVLELEDLRGRPALVTFAFGHCESVCPAVVRQVLDARDRAETDAPPSVVVITLDPWRDTPAGLSRVARHWHIDDGAWVLSGDVTRVNEVLDAWNVARERDESTGDVVHPPLVYVLDATGRIAFASTGGVDALVSLLDRV